jgi:dynein heavy chain, axonemal
MPALEAAKLALDDLNRNDITEIKAFKNPPALVELVCNCIVILKGYKEVNWKQAQAMMAANDFLQQLQRLDVDGITRVQITSVIGLVKMIEDKLEIESEDQKEQEGFAKMKKVSGAGAGLLKFVYAIVGYNKVFATVKPKRDKVRRKFL